MNEFESLTLTKDEEASIKDGKVVYKEGATEGIYRLYNEDTRFIGLAEGDAVGNLKVKRLMSI